MKDISKQLAPLYEVLKQRRRELGLNNTEIARRAGKRTGTWVSELDSGKATNPEVSRLATLAEAHEVQEFGVYVVIDGHFTSAPLIGGDEDPDVEVVEEEEEENADDDLTGS